jgi:hypothetical protein
MDDYIDTLWQERLEEIEVEDIIYGKEQVENNDKEDGLTVDTDSEEDEPFVRSVQYADPGRTSLG